MFALVTCHAAREVDSDLPLLQRELPEATIVCWDDESVDWSLFDRVVIRSTWDYHTRRDAFLEWAGAVSDVAALWNPLALIRWNTDKRYLVELDHVGIPIVATTFLPEDADVDALAEAGGFVGDLIVKPTVGASAVGVVATRGDEVAAIAHARRLLATGSTPMVQPYLTGVEQRGETCLVYLGGEFSHAVGRHVVMCRTTEFDGDVFGEERSASRRATANVRSAMRSSPCSRRPRTRASTSCRRRSARWCSKSR